MDSKFRHTTDTTSQEYFDSGNFSYPIVPHIRRETRRCRIINYIPHNTPRNTNLETWSRAYIVQLIDIFNIIMDTIMKSKLYKNIDWESSIIYNNLCKLIYHCSSKYILPELKYDYDYDE